MTKIIEIVFKDEGELHGESVGPVTVVLDDTTKVRYGWRRLRDAEAFAAHHQLLLERI
jgi:hypothetical protein